MGAQEITCIICPVGCKAKVTLREGEVVEIKGLECPRGEEYVVQEVKDPRRDFFTTVRIKGAKTNVLPVRSTAPLPKQKLLECARELAGVEVEAPVKLGEVVVKNVLGLGIDIIATRDLPRAKDKNTRGRG